MFKKIYSSDGRIRRTEYGYSLIISATLYAAVMRVLTNESMTSESIMETSFVCISPFVFFILSQGAKRCHDMGQRGWMQFIPFYFLLMIFQESTPGVNRFGENPKHQGDFELELFSYNEKEGEDEV